MNALNKTWDLCLNKVHSPPLQPAAYFVDRHALPPSRALQQLLRSGPLSVPDAEGDGYRVACAMHLG